MSSLEDSFTDAAQWQKIFTQALLALRKGDLLRLKDIIDDGLGVNATDGFGCSLLCHAAGTGDAQSASLLLSLGANVDHQNTLGRTALMIAASRGDARMIETLLCAKPQLDITEKSCGNTALHIAFEHNGGTIDEIFTRLLDAGASPLVRNKNGETPLMLAKRASPALQSLAAQLEEAEAARQQDILSAIETARTTGTARPVTKAASIRF